MSHTDGKTRQARLRPHAARSRRIVFWTLGLFAALQIGGGLLLDHVWPQIRFPMAEKYCEEVHAMPQPPDIVFLGSSRLGMAVDPRAVSHYFDRVGVSQPVRAINASNSAGDLVTAEHMFHKLGRAAHPSLVVLEVSPETVARYNCWIRDHTFRQLTWRDAPQGFVNVCARGQMGNFLATRLMPLYVHRYQIVKSYQNACVDLLKDAPKTPPPQTVTVATAAGEETKIADPIQRLSQDLNKSDAPRVRTAGRDVTRWLSNYHAGGGMSETSLVPLLRRCEKRNIAVLLVGIPVATDHFNRYTADIEREYQGFIDRMVREHGCRYVDFRNKIPDEYFVDHHHLSLDGCRQFTRMLTEEVLLPEWMASHVSKTD